MEDSGPKDLKVPLLLNSADHGPRIVLLPNEGEGEGDVAQRRGGKQVSLSNGEEGGGVTQRRGGKQQKEPSAASSELKQEQRTTVADLRLVLVYGQWIWPLIPFSGFTRMYNFEDQYMFAMIGNALMLAGLWWIKSAPPTESTSKQPQGLGRSDILPTVVWGILPPSSAILGDEPELFVLLLLFILVPVLILRVMRNNGSRMTLRNRLVACSEHFVSFKHLEEEYFEHLREQEDEESQCLLEQQERLAYLEEERSKKGENAKKRMWPLYIVFLLSAVSVGSLFYNMNFGTPSITVYKPLSASRTRHQLPTTTKKENAYRSVTKRSGSHVIDITQESWPSFLKENEMAFVNICTPWDIWSQRLAPTWEQFAAEVKTLGMPVGVAKIDCMAQAELCRELKVMAFPTLRWYTRGQLISPDYKMDRTVQAFMGFARRKLEMD